jgi:hypothetical protein
MISAAMPATLAPFAAWRPCAHAQPWLRAAALRRARMLVSDERSLDSPALSILGAGVFSKFLDDLGGHASNRSPSVMSGVFQHALTRVSNARNAARETREMSIFTRERSTMNCTAEASDLLGVIAGAAGSKKERQLRAWRRLVSEFPRSTWTFNRVHDLFTCDPRARVRAREIEELRIAARVERRTTKTQAYHDDLVTRIETAIALSRARRTRPSVVSLRELLGGDRTHDRAVDQDS